MKKFLVIPSFLLLLTACGGSDQKPAEATPSNEAAETQTPAADPAAEAAADNAKGFGKFTNVELKTPLDQAMANNGEQVYKMKCASCHRLDEKKLVGPGYKGVTSRRSPEWIMNFVTNVDENLDKDPQAMAMLEECLVRMPNQNLSDSEARDVLEFMRKNDGVN